MRVAILSVTVPATIMTSDWRGVARKAPAPKRSRSYRDAPVAIISMAQHARPKVMGQSDPERAQLKSLSSDAMTTLSSNFPSKTPMLSSPSLRRKLHGMQFLLRPGRLFQVFRLHPLQIPFGPDVRKTHSQNGDKYQSLDEGKHAELLEYHRPGQQEDDLHIENDENEGNNVKANVELYPGRTCGILPAFIGDVFLGRILSLVTHDGSKNQAPDEKHHRHYHEQEHARKTREHSNPPKLNDWRSAFLTRLH